jgi:enoyl-CoA hydratase/carnithine racemase
MTARPYSKIKVHTQGSVCTILLHNPARKNAIGTRMVNELLFAIADAHEDAAVRSIVLTGEGSAFCAGGDFGQMTSEANEEELPPNGDYADLLLAMVNTEKPIIARVNGVAMGGGLGLVAASTFAVAQSGAVLATPEINVGLFPMMIMAVLARVVPRRKLTEMMLFGEKMSAEDALAAGLLNKVVSAESLDAVIHADYCDRIAKKSPKTVALGLRAYAKQSDMPLEEALPYLRGELGNVLSTDDAREGLMAFLEKRTPHWTGK